jgi:uncharacterized membrane protein
MGNTITFTSLQLGQFTAVLLTGLVSGLFYGYQCSVIKGLADLENDVYLKSFQSINKVIQNPLFFINFIGSLIVLPIACWLSFKHNNMIGFYLMLSATLIYFIGVFGVTIFCNVPLNNQLDNFSIVNAKSNEIAKMRKAFEKPWNAYHIVRTIAAVISFGLAILSIIKNKH